MTDDLMPADEVFARVEKMILLADGDRDHSNPSALKCNDTMVALHLLRHLKTERDDALRLAAVTAPMREAVTDDDDDDASFVEAMMRSTIENKPMRLVIVSDGDRAWYVRRVRVTEHDLDLDEKVYRCDLPIGPRFNTLDQAIECARNALASGQEK